MEGVEAYVVNPDTPESDMELKLRGECSVLDFIRRSLKGLSPVTNYEQR
jgi:hypothetical protein